MFSVVKQVKTAAGKAKKRISCWKIQNFKRQFLSQYWTPSFELLNFLAEINFMQNPRVGLYLVVYYFFKKTRGLNADFFFKFAVIFINWSGCAKIKPCNEIKWKWWINVSVSKGRENFSCYDWFSIGLSWIVNSKLKGSIVKNALNKEKHISRTFIYIKIKSLGIFSVQRFGKISKPPPQTKICLLLQFPFPFMLR